jgi:TolB-like protein/DNA-binding winged helix-turn-helix (wHTH) protein/Tfp pilus assembly protein PilF
VKELPKPVHEPLCRIYCFDRFTLDLVRGTLCSGSDEVKLRPKSFELLTYLVENTGRLVAKEELIAALWPGAAVTDDSLVQCIKEVRRALDDDAQALIKTVPRRGYLFDSEVTSGSSPPHSLAGGPAEPIRLLPVQPVKRRVAVVRRNNLIIAGCVLAVVSAAVGWHFRRSVSTASPSATVAVLPFQPLMPDAASKVADERLGVGMADALILQLSKIQGIVVRPTSAVLGYMAPQKDLRAAGKNLRVDSLLEGSMQTSGDHIRVTVQLVSVRDGNPLWAEKFDEKFTDIFAVEDSIAGRVAEALRLRLTREDRDRLKRRYASNAKAYRLYLEGRYFWTKREGKSAIDYFRKALTEDPKFAPAYAGLADCYSELAMAGRAPSSEVLPTAKAAAMQALAIDERLAEAHASLGQIKSFYDWDWSGGEREFQRAIELNPGSLTAHSLYALQLACVSRLDAAIVQVGRALEVDPFAPNVNVQLGLYRFMQRNYDQAIEQYGKTLELSPNFNPAYLQLGWCYEQKAMWREAIAALERAIAISPDDPRTIASLARAYAMSGKRAEALKLVDKLEDQSKKRHVAPFWIAEAYVGLGDKDRAFEWLERGYQEHDVTTPFMNVCPLCDPLRPDPRFASLVRRMGLLP